MYLWDSYESDNFTVEVHAVWWFLFCGFVSGVLHVSGFGVFCFFSTALEVFLLFLLLLRRSKLEQ